MLTRMPRLTKTQVERIQPTDRDIFEWDDRIKGFGVRVKPSGVRSYIVQYRNLHGRSRRITIGKHGRWTAEEARKHARLLLGQADRGEDPVEDKMAARSASTVKEFAERYFADYAPAKKKASSIGTDRTNLRLHILPAIGNLPIKAVTRADAVRLHQSMKDTPGAANRTMCLVSHMMNIAEAWGLRQDGTNPCRHVEKYKEVKRERYLSAEELARLGDALSKDELPAAVAAIRLLVLTGCRRAEILTLRWEYVDLKDGCLRLPDSKTGSKVVHLNAPALEVLRDLGPKETGWVIEGAKPGAHLVNLKKPWYRIRKAADLEDVRIHDLRHSYASVAAGLGEGLHIIGKLLGHSQAQTTHRYAHLAADPIKAANERVGSALAGMMNGGGHERTG